MSQAPPLDPPVKGLPVQTKVPLLQGAEAAQFSSSVLPLYGDSPG